MRKFEEAIECLNKAIEINPNDPLFWFSKAEILDRMGKHEEAKMCYMKAAEFEEKSEEIFESREN